MPMEHREMCWPWEGIPSCCWDKAQELIHVTHKEPIGEEPHGGLHLLGAQEVLQGLVHVPALAAALAGIRSYDRHQRQ